MTKRIDWDIVLLFAGVVGILVYLYLDIDHIGAILAGVIAGGAEERWRARRARRRDRGDDAGGRRTLK